MTKTCLYRCSLSYFVQWFLRMGYSMNKLQSDSNYLHYTTARLSDLEGAAFAPKAKLTPEYIAQLMEARDFGQFAQDFDQPLAKPLRASICQMLDNIQLVSAERDQWKHEAMHGGNATYLRERIVELELQLQTVKQHDAEAVQVRNEAIRENNQTRFEASLNLNQDI